MKTELITTAIVLALGIGTFTKQGMAGGASPLPTSKSTVPPVTQSSAMAQTALMDMAEKQGNIRVIVMLRTPSSPEATLMPDQVTEQRAALQATQGKVLEALRQHTTTINEDSIKRFSVTPGFAMETTPDIIRQLLENPDVENVVEDKMNFPMLYESSPLIGAANAWASGYTGAGQAVAILDTGVAKSHPFLNGKVVSEACYSTNATGSGWTATSLCPGGAASSTAVNSGLNCDVAVSDGCSHGTHVAGIAAGKNGASSGGTMSGVARDANIIAIQVFSKFVDSSGTYITSYNSDTLLALERVYALRSTYTIAAVNMSLGGGQYSSTCDSDPRKPIIDNLRAAGIATVISSGNNGWNGATGAPGCISSAITVGSSTKADSEASYSNMASWVDLFGPGSSICSSIPGTGFTGATSCGTGYQFANGTSMAAPQVAGAWAVMKSKKPSATVAEIENALESTGVPIATYLGNWPRIALVPVLAALGGGGGGNTGKLINLSTRGQVGTGDNILIGGFVIGGTDSKKVVVRGMGPSMAGTVPGTLNNPEITLFSGATPILSNDNWGTAANAAEISALGLAPGNSSEAAILTTQNPGAYTFHLRGVGGATGIGQVEVYTVE